MTLDEAIIHARDVASSGCSECCNEHAQLANWLEELKMRRNIDDSIHEDCISRKELLEMFPPMQPDSAAIVKKVVTEAFPIRLWIKVEDMLPSESGTYFVTIEDYTSEDTPRTIALEAWYDYSKRDFGNLAWTLLNEFYDLSDILRDKITYWMPYPKTPNEVTVL